MLLVATLEPLIAAQLATLSSPNPHPERRLLSPGAFGYWEFASQSDFKCGTDFTLGIPLFNSLQEASRNARPLSYLFFCAEVSLFAGNANKLAKERQDLLCVTRIGAGFSFWHSLPLIYTWFIKFKNTEHPICAQKDDPVVVLDQDFNNLIFRIFLNLSKSLSKVNMGISRRFDTEQIRKSVFDPCMPFF